MRKYLLVFIVFLTACLNNKTPLTTEENQWVEDFKTATQTELQYNNPDSAIVLTAKILSIRQKIKNPHLLFDALVMRGTAWQNLGQFDSTKFYNKMAYEFAMDRDNDTLVAKGLFQMGNSMLNYDNYEAMKYFRQAYKLNTRLNMLTQRANNLSHIGLSFDYMGNSDSAVSYYLKAVSDYDSLENYLNKAIVLHNIGTIYNELEEYQKAISYQQRSIEILRQLNDVNELSSSLNSLGLVYLKMENTDAALELFNEAIALADSVNALQYKLMAQFNKGKCLSQMGRYAEANPVLDEVYQVCLDYGIVEGQMYYLLQKGQNYSEVGKTGPARELLEKGLALSTDGRALEMETEFLTALVKLSLSNLSDSLLTQRYERLNHLNDSLNKNEMNLKVAEIENQFQARKKDMEITTLKHEKRVFLYGIVALVIIVLLILSLIVVLYLLYRKKHQLLEQKTRQLANATLSKSHMNQFIIKLKKDLQQTGHENKLKPIKTSLSNMVLDLDRYGKQNPATGFETTFSELHPHFYSKLSKDFPELTPKELELCAYIRLNMNSKEIAGLSFRSVNTIEATRYQIRKKMNLARDVNLTAFLLKY
jgi:tetratricopeptide (TPR) repeat protein/DNA-binding CsgD family transcriptional regulator